MELPFAAIVQAVQQTLLPLSQQNPPVTIATDGFPMVSSDLCPIVDVQLTSAQYTPMNIVAMNVIPGQDRVVLDIQLSATAFSAESSADAALQRDLLVQTIVDLMRQNPQLSGTVLSMVRSRVSFSAAAAPLAGFFSTATITLECQALS